MFISRSDLSVGNKDDSGCPGRGKKSTVLTIHWKNTFLNYLCGILLLLSVAQNRLSDGGGSGNDLGFES